MENPKRHKASLLKEEDSDFHTLSVRTSSFSSHVIPDLNLSPPKTPTSQLSPKPIPLSTPLSSPAIPTLTSSPKNTLLSTPQSLSAIPTLLKLLSQMFVRLHHHPSSQTLPYSQQPPQHTSSIQNPRTNSRKRESVTRNPNEHQLRRCAPKKNKSETITPPPFPWVTNRRATIHSRRKLLEESEPIRTISGDVHCKKCDQTYTLEFDLDSKFKEVSKYILENDHKMYHKAPEVWLNPELPTCSVCNRSEVRPVITKKRSINWLFLFLGQMLGCCTLQQLKYYGKHSEHFRTGSKDRILYSTYIGICEQLLPGFKKCYWKYAV